MDSNTIFISGTTGVIYERAAHPVRPAGGSGSSASNSLMMLKPVQHDRFSTAIRAFGYTCMVMAFVTIISLGWPIMAAEVAYRLNRMLPGAVAEEEITPPVKFGDLTQKETVEPSIIPQNASFSLAIPKIGVNTKVIPNVNAADEEEYLKALQQGVAHAKGTYLPGQKGNIYIFGHSTDYVWNVAMLNAQFYLLKELVVDDEIVVFYNNKKYIYRVTATHIVEASDVSFMEPKSGTETLILQTCWPPGTSWKRYIVEAIPVLDK